MISTAHLMEHIVQMWQIKGMKCELSKANGIIGYWFPWLMTSEVLHYGYAFIMLVGFIALRPGFVGFRGITWWDVALWIQVWHFFEHVLLISQAIVGQNILDYDQPMSVLQFFVPRAELHFTYNAIIFIPTCVAIWRHWGTANGQLRCNCNNQPVRQGGSRG